MADDSNKTMKHDDGSGDPVQRFFKLERDERRRAFSAMSKDEKTRTGLKMFNSVLKNMSSRYPTEYIVYAFFQDALTPFIENELSKPEYSGLTIEDLFREMEELPPDQRSNSRFVKVIQIAIRASTNAQAETEEKKELRTAAKAKEAHNINSITSNFLALITDKDYLNAVSLYEQGNAYMKQITMDGLQFNDGKLYFAGDEMREVSMVELRNLQTNKNIDAINLPFLQFCYSQIMGQWERTIQDEVLKGGSGEIDPVTRFYLPDLAKARGLPANASKESLEAIKKDISSFHNVVGVLKVEGYSKPSLYPVLNFEGFDTTTNVISFSSPYLLHVVQVLFKTSVRRDKKGNPKLRSDGYPQTRAINSYLVHSSIMKKRDKSAVQNVFLLVQGIERCGDNVYDIMAETLIERNTLFKTRLEESKNKRVLLQRCFTNTWKYLKECTDLEKKYIDIELPDPKNPANIPSVATLKNFKIVIRHKGIDRSFSRTE